jgi:hypothetical protein
VLAEGGDTTLDKDGCFSSGGSVSEPPIWLTACHISIVLERCRHKVLSDSQASGNLMTRSFADEHGFPVKQNFQAFQMIDGTTILSTGFTWVLCGIKNNTASVHHRLFYIFERLHVPVLIGRSFWEESQSRRSISASRVCDDIHYPCIPLMFHENGKNKRVVMSALDTGIVSNLMSLGYARRERLSMMAPPSRQIRASNGRLVSIVGTVRVKLQLGSVQEVPLYCVFWVVVGLPYDVGLDRNFLFDSNNKLAILYSLTYITRVGYFVLGEAEEKDLSKVGNAWVEWRSKKTDLVIFLN